MWNEVKIGDDEKECAVVGCGIPLLLRGGFVVLRILGGSGWGDS